MLMYHGEMLFTKEEIELTVPEDQLREFQKGWDELIQSGYVEEVTKIGGVSFYRILDIPRNRKG